MIVRTDGSLQCRDTRFLLIVEEFDQNVSLFVVIEYHLEIGSHRNPVVGCPGIMDVIHRPSHIVILQAYETIERKYAGIMSETQVRCSSAAVFKGCISLLQKISQQVLGRVRTDLSVFLRVSELTVELV